MADDIDYTYFEVGYSVDPALVGDPKTFIPNKRVGDLPLYTSTSDLQLVGYLGNDTAVRVPASQFVGFRLSEQTPSSPGAPGTNGQISVTDQGIFVFFNSWFKVPAYSVNWDDLDGNERFLPVNKTIQLTDTEKSSVWESIDLSIATNDSIGLVKGSETANIAPDGSISINIAKAKQTGATEAPGLVNVIGDYTASTTRNEDDYVTTERYVNTAITSAIQGQEQTIASIDRLGVVKIDPHGSINIDEVGTISVHISSTTDTGADPVPGLVSMGNMTVYNPEEASYAAPVGLVFNMISSAVSDLPVATKAALGVVSIGQNINVSSSGSISVDSASISGRGVVQLTEAIDNSPAAENRAVTSKAVVNYVTKQISNISQSLPIATASSLGTVKIGSGLSVAPGGVLSLQNATANSIGGVTVAGVQGDPDPYKVPSLALVENLIGTSGGSGGTSAKATYATFGTVKLGTASTIYDGIPVGVGADQRLAISTSSLQEAISGSEGSSIRATYDSLGTVRLGSKNYKLNANTGIAIGCDSNGRIFVDRADTSAPATNARYGLVKLSTDTIITGGSPIGLNAAGQIVSAATSSSGGTGGSGLVVGGSTTIDFDNCALVGKDREYGYMAISAATNIAYGAVKLGTGTTVTEAEGIPIGVNLQGQLYAATSGGGSTVPQASYNGFGTIKLGTPDLLVGNTYPVGFNAAGNAVVKVPEASTTEKGMVALESDDLLNTYAPVSKANTENGGLAVPAATYLNYGVVKLSDVDLSAGTSYSKVGVTPEGVLAVPTGSATGAAFTTTLQKIGASNNYRILMSGGVIELSNGTLVEIQEITAQDNIIVAAPADEVIIALQVDVVDGIPTATITMDTTADGIYSVKPSFIG